MHFPSEIHSFWVSPVELIPRIFRKNNRDPVWSEECESSLQTNFIALVTAGTILRIPKSHTASDAHH
jgi:hypothetical protein